MEFLNSRESEEKVVRVSREHVESLWKQRSQNTTLAACVNVIRSKILGPGFSFINLDGKEPDESFDRHVRKHFLPFAEKALENLLVQGFCVYGIRPRNEKTVYPVPYVVCREAYGVEVYRDRAEERIRLVKTDEHERRKFHVFVESVPQADGKVSSRVSNVTHIVNYAEELEKHDLQAFAVRSIPPVLTKTQTDNSFDSRDVISGAVPGLRAQDESDNMEIRNKITIQQFRQQQDLIATLNKERIDSSKSFWMQHLDPSKNTLLSETIKRESEGFVPKFVPLPNDADVARYEIPPERRDFVDLKRFCKTQICVGMGVPESAVDGKFDNRTSAGQSKTTDEFTRVSLMPLKNSLSALLVELYENSIGEADRIDCNFPGLQNIDRMFFWYQNGLLKRTALVRSICDLELLRPADFIEEQTVGFGGGVRPVKRIKQLDNPNDEIIER